MARSKKMQSKNPFATIANEFGGDPYGIKQFRHHLSILKKKGLISHKTDVRKQKATRHYIDVIRKFRDVIEGKAKTVKVTTKEKQYFVEAGRRVRNGHAVVSVPSPKSRVTKGHSGKFPVIKIATPVKGATKRTESVLVPHSEFEMYLHQKVMRAKKEKKGRFYGFRFFGNNSFNTWSDRERLFQEFLKYDSVAHAANRDNPQEQDEIYQNFEIVTIETNEDFSAYLAERKAQNEARNERAKEYRRQRRKAHPRELTGYEKDARMDREAARRERLKNDSDPTAYLEYKKKAVERARKSRENAKKKRS